MSQARVIGITGGIGSGKTTLSNLLRAEGFEVYDSDLEAKRLQNEHPAIVGQLSDLFGSSIYQNSQLNRPEVARRVFENKELLGKLNKIVHPFVKQHFEDWVKTKSEHHELLFLESAILFESGFNSLVDKVIVVTASVEERIKRVVKRDGICAERVRTRMANQIPEAEKIAKADFVIHTDDDNPLSEKISKILIQLSYPPTP
ncbi:MAG TPA: dephospho-CoA kinase [Paludibacter sp.]|nr:dephospho-CoA kinase [Paludibacter sp.]